MNVMDASANSLVSLDMRLVFQIGGQQTNDKASQDNAPVSSSDNKTRKENTSPKESNTSNSIDLLA